MMQQSWLGKYPISEKSEIVTNLTSEGCGND